MAGYHPRVVGWRRKHLRIFSEWGYEADAGSGLGVAFGLSVLP